MSAAMSDDESCRVCESAPEQDAKVYISEAARDASSMPQDVAEAQVPVEITPRAYQIEMLEQSLQQNVIVVMDTGSGKTQIAVLRIKAELERASPDKIIWFLAPTVALCGQQFNLISRQITSVRIRLLTGNENVDTWDEDAWGMALKDVRIVVSTYQILFDALSNAFVSINGLSLIIFDEAHNCVEKHPGSKLMTNFYHMRRHRGGDMPSILGLTATPSSKSNFKGVEDLEAILDAKCVSPTLHRQTLLHFVQRPEIICAKYAPEGPELVLTKAMRRLRDARLSLDITQDPYILSLRAEPTAKNLRSLKKAIEGHETNSQNQIKHLYNCCVEIHRQLGPWAADVYLHKACTSYLDRVNGGDGVCDQVASAERVYLAAFLRRVMPEPPPLRPQTSFDLSDKATVLLEQLVSMEPDVAGIIFVKERSMTAMLCELLASCPRIAERYRIGSMVGGSTHSARKRKLQEFWHGDSQTGLQDFRSGAVNLLVGTSVLEEGIDVPACNLVVCFSTPDTPKAFVQRRGRARMRASKLVWFTEHSSHVIKQWEEIERELKCQFEDQQREIRRIESLQDSESGDDSYFEVESTGALLDLDQAKARLQHFCNTASKSEFTNRQPDYVLRQHWDSSPPRLSAVVLLPPFVPEALRRVEGKSTWLSEKNATKDAAFQACLALYKAGLLSEHLLPLKFDVLPSLETRAPEIDIEPPFNPWYQVARKWEEGDRRWLHALSFVDENQVRTDYEVLLPVRLQQVPPIKLYLNSGEVCEVRFGQPQSVTSRAAASQPDHTPVLLALSFSHRWKVNDDPQVVKFTVKGVDELSRKQVGSTPFDLHNEKHCSGDFIVRDQCGTPYQYNGQVAEKPPVDMVQHPISDHDFAPSDEPYLILTRWTRRTEFLHSQGADASRGVATTKRYGWVLPGSRAVVDELPAKYAKFGMLTPSITHELQVMLVVQELATGILRRVSIGDLGLIREAVSARSAHGPVHYERLEFLGDSVLKYCASVQVIADHPDWPEGYLSSLRDSLVSNARLSRASVSSGLAKFILTKPFNGRKWRPLYLDEYLQQTRERETGGPMSTKTLADVVEALIGASYIDGGLPKALACMSTFMDECEWQGVERGRERLFQLARSNDMLPPVLEPLERLIGYSFQKKSLLIEAVTHGSNVFDTGKRSYERLEFLGDAVLDHIIVTKLCSIQPPLPHCTMHTLKTAMVNADFLAFVVLEHRVSPDGNAATGVQGDECENGLALWNFMRHASSHIAAAQERVRKRHGALRTAIIEAMEGGSHYPWALLARMQARKFFSDLFEAVLGAIWVDSGSKEACEAVVARFGILSYLERLLTTEVEVMHPKEILGKLAVADTVTYSIDAKQGIDGETKYVCVVQVGDRVVAEVDDGVSREEVQTKAAYEAVRLLRGEQESSRVG